MALLAQRGALSGGGSAGTPALDLECIGDLGDAGKDHHDSNDEDGGHGGHRDAAERNEAGNQVHDPESDDPAGFGAQRREFRQATCTDTRRAGHVFLPRPAVKQEFAASKYLHPARADIAAGTVIRLAGSRPASPHSRPRFGSLLADHQRCQALQRHQ
jgi:hypothetical protein